MPARKPDSRAAAQHRKKSSFAGFGGRARHEGRQEMRGQPVGERAAFVGGVAREDLGVPGDLIEAYRRVQYRRTNVASG